MIVNSITFLIFFSIVFILYYAGQKGIKWDNKGSIIFKGHCHIGNESFVSVGKNGILTIGEDVTNTGKLKIICAKEITIDEHNRLGWETLIMDTSFHPLFDIEKQTFLPAIRSVHIGANNWLGMQCVKYPRTLHIWIT